MAQLSKGTTYSATAPGKYVTHTNLNAHVDNATLLQGAITEQTEETSTAADDMVLVSDTSAGALRSVQLANLLPAGGGGIAADQIADEAVTLAKVGSDLAPFLCPTGVVLPYGGASAPTGWLVCDGSAVSRTTYADLFTAISTAFGVGDGSTTFNLPDLRRRVAVGAGGTGTATLANSVGSTGGEEDHTLTTAEMPAHTHTTNAALLGGSGFGGGFSGGSLSEATSDSTGGDGAHNNLPPSLVLNYIIKT